MECDSRPITTEDSREIMSQDPYSPESYLFCTWLTAQIQIPVGEDFVKSCMITRCLSANALFADVSPRDRDLCKADALWALGTSGVDRMGSARDEDNGWSHSDGGFSLSKETKRLLRREALSLYAAHDETPPNGGVSVSVTQYGIHRSRHSTLFPNVYATPEDC